jgi:hypothetical protein
MQDLQAGYEEFRQSYVSKSDISMDLVQSSLDYEELWSDIHDHCHLNDNKEKMLNTGLGFVNDEMIVLGYETTALITKYAHNEKSKKISKFVNLALEVYRLSNNSPLKVFLINYLRSKEPLYPFSDKDVKDIFI